MKGIKIPFEASPSGGFVTQESEEQLHKLLSVALNDCSSSNPFQDLGIEPPIFDINDDVTQTIIEDRVRAIFELFEDEGRAKLTRDGISFEIDSEKQELITNIKYIDISTSQIKSFTKTLRGVA